MKKNKKKKEESIEDVKQKYPFAEEDNRQFIECSGLKFFVSMLN